MCDESMLTVSGHTGASTALVCVTLTDDRRSSAQILMLFSSWWFGDLMWNVKDSVVPVNFTECV